MAGAKISIGSTAGELQQDANGNAKVNLPTLGAQAGFVREAYVPDSTIVRPAKITDTGQLYAAEIRQLFHAQFNSAATNWSYKFGTNATTMTKAVTNGFMRLNSGASTTTTTGISIYSNRVILIEDGYDYRIKFRGKHVNIVSTNKQVDVGLGYYAFAAGQAAAMNEFLGFRWTTTGGLQGVMETTDGGAVTTQTVNLNGNAPYSDNVARDYELVFNDRFAEFWVNGAYQAQIAVPTAMWAIFKQQALPVIARGFNSGTASLAWSFDIGSVSVNKVGPDDGAPHSYRVAGMGKSSLYFQSDLTTATTATHNMPASGTVPTAATGSNTASVLNSTAQMGGAFRMNGASITVTAHSTIWAAGFQNPALPTAAGGATNTRNFYVTGIVLSPLVVSTVLVGGGFTANWIAGIGATALSTATTDADGTTAVAQKAYRYAPLSRAVSFAAAAAAATFEVGLGDFSTTFTTPLVIHPGEFLSIGLRTTTVAAAVTSGTIDGFILVNGFWD
jgi:hypothetical protein